MSEENKNNFNTPEVIVLKFADSQIPVFKESRNKDYIKYGEDNQYPEYLTYLFNKSAKHNAIITGKSFYIFGQGFANGDIKINRLGETLNDISKKAIKDIEIYGGYRWEVIYNALGKICEVYHVDYTTLRRGKVSGFYYKQCWDVHDREEPRFVPEFDPSQPFGSQIYAYNEYRPMVRFYPLPSYIGANNYIETDIEISKYYLSAIRNGMMPSKMIQFYGGDPGEEAKREIERRFKNKFGGSENAGRFILVFNQNKDKSTDVQDLSASEVDKQFVELNKTCQQEIYSGHLITNPMLFGIKTEGQLGGATELSTAYSIFQNTYAKPKADAFANEVTYLLGFSIFAGQYEIQPTDPIGVQFDVKDVINALPKAFVFGQLGIPEDLWNTENIGSDNRPTPTLPVKPAPDIIPGDPSATQPAATPGATPKAPAQQAEVNDNIKNLTAKQHQQLVRIIKQYTQGKLTEQAAKALLRAGLGLNDKDINDLLGIKTQMSAQDEEDAIIAMFDECGENKDDYDVLISKRVSFSSELEMELDEEVYIKSAFATFTPTLTESKIIELIRKDPNVTPEVIAKAVGQTVAWVKSKLTDFARKGYIEEGVKTIGEDEIVERRIVDSVVNAIKPPASTIEKLPDITIKYSYEGPRDDRNRPFCAKMLELHRLYTRADIEKISQRLGYSVFDRRGGFWRHKGTKITTPYCRHNWKSNIVIKKK